MRIEIGFAWRWIKVIWPFLVGALVLVTLSMVSMQILSATRAYVEGESLWSKAQKEAVFHLNQYSSSGDEAAFDAYLRAIAVPLGDRKARLELEKPEFDRDIARQGFLEGRNHPDDIEGMIRLFRNFKNISLMRKPISIWTEGDRLIAALIVEAEKLYAETTLGHPNSVSQKTILDQCAPDAAGGSVFLQPERSVATD